MLPGDNCSSPLVGSAELQPLAELVLLLVDESELGHDFDPGLSAPLALLLKRLDPALVALAVLSSESVARLAKSLELLLMLFHVALEAADASDSSIEIATLANVSSRQSNGSRCQDRASPCDADPVQP